MSEQDPYGLERFVAAQSEDFDCALGELQRGRKESHWIWYIFPQVAGLGHSAMAQKYAIQSREEAVAYLNHPVLGRRLQQCCDESPNAISQGAGIDRSLPENAGIRGF